MLVASHPTRCWDWCMPEDKKKKRKKEKKKNHFLLMKNSVRSGSGKNVFSVCR